MFNEKFDEFIYKIIIRSPFILLSVFGASLLGFKFYYDNKENKAYDNLKSDYVTEDVTDEIDTNNSVCTLTADVIENNETVTEEVVTVDENKNEDMNINNITWEYRSSELLDNGYSMENIDFDGLESVNSDVKAWINIPNTSIDYPVVQSENLENDYYLHHDLNNNDSNSGTLYVDNSEEDISNMNEYNQNMSNIYTIYGHNMKNGSMFNNIAKYDSKSYCDNHNYGVIYTEDKVFMLVPMAVVTFSGEDSRILNIDGIKSVEEFNNYVSLLKENAIYTTEELDNLEFGESIVNNVTCYYSHNNYRICVVFKVKEQYKSYADINYDENVQYR